MLGTLAGGVVGTAYLYRMIIGIGTDEDTETNTEGSSEALATSARPDESDAGAGLDAIEQGSPELRDFLHRGFLSWKTGVFDEISHNLRESADQHGEDALVRNTLRSKTEHGFLKACFDVREPDADELIVMLVPGSFLLTTKNLFLVTDPKSEDPRVMSLCEIASYTITARWRVTTELALRSGERIRVKVVNAG